MRFCILAVPITLVTSGTFAQELPTTDALTARVALPTFWEVQEFRVVAQAMVGTPIEPRAQIRFEILASPSRDLFVPSGDESLGPFITVVESTADETTRTIYGTMDLRYAAGQWDGPVVVENPVGDLGQPLDSFTVPTLVLGSERQAEVADAIRASAAAELRIVLDSDRRTLMEQQAGEVEAMRTSHLNTISALRQEFEAARIEADRLKSGMEAEIERVNAELEQRMTEGVARLGERLTAAEAEHEAELSALRSAHAVRLRELETAQSAELGTAITTHLEELQALETGHARAIGELVAEQEREMAEVTTRLATRKASLDAQIAAADEVLALQAALAARQTAIGINDASITAAEQERQVQFGQSLDGLRGVWTGIALCDREGRGAEPFTVSMDLQEIQGRSVAGRLVDTSRPNNMNGSTVASLHLTGNDLTMPLSLQATLNNGGTLGTTSLDLTLQPDGWMIGQSADSRCTEVRLSRS